MSFQMKKNKIMKHRILRYLFSLTFVATTFSLGGCIDTIDPSSTLTAQQVKKLTSSQQGLLNGIISYVIDFNSWGSRGYPTNDWGYPCQMFLERFLGLISLSIVVTIAIGRQWKAVSTPVSRLITPIVFTTISLLPVTT